MDVPHARSYNYLVVVAENETIGKIHQRITGQWADVLNGSVSKFVEFESEKNIGIGNGEMYKKLRLVRSNDIKHLKLELDDPYKGFDLYFPKKE
uniref:Uncharacterized protein n=1 Tax=Meloidogyne enterolobii TaxID=390850 RepID=A0A6V7VIE5_MELEN|nr:unnamed protein product [Meloidogyne enterolobii]